MSFEKSRNVLVIGGGNPNLYPNSHFYEIGDHTSYFGKSKDWSKNTFWFELEEKLKQDVITFDCIIFDTGSESWLFNISSDVLNIMAQVIISHMNPHAILITEIDLNPTILHYSKINNLFLDNGLYLVGSTYFTKYSPYCAYNILSRVPELKLKNQQGIHKPNSTFYIPILNHDGEDTKYKKTNEIYEKPIEDNQIIFCINRIINEV